MQSLSAVRLTQRRSLIECYFLAELFQRFLEHVWFDHCHRFNYRRPCRGIRRELTSPNAAAKRCCVDSWNFFQFEICSSIPNCLNLLIFAHVKTAVTHVYTHTPQPTVTPTATATPPRTTSQLSFWLLSTLVLLELLVLFSIINPSLFISLNRC